MSLRPFGCMLMLRWCLLNQYFCLFLVCDDGVVVVCEDILVCGGVVTVNVVEDAYELKYSGRI